MQYTTSEVLELTRDIVLEQNIAQHMEYGWIDGAKIPQRPNPLSRCLFLSTYCDGTDGWHTRFDRRPLVPKLLAERDWHIAVDTSREETFEAQLVVSSLKDFCRRIYSNARERTRPVVIGVTGSVGKTTTVAFLEHLLRVAGRRVVRFWSKRLTPLLVETHYINRVFPNTEFVVLEYSAYREHHVGRLAETLPPDISFFTNLYNQHIRKDLFKSKLDILNSKLRIHSALGKAYINSAILKDLGIDRPSGWSAFNVADNLERRNPNLPPTVRTAELYTVGALLANEVGIDLECFYTAVESFIPKEDRLVRCGFTEGELFFDTEAPHGPRLWSWFETIDGSIPTLLVEDITFGNDDTSTYLTLLERIFGSDKTFVLDTTANRANIPVAVRQFVNERRFREALIECIQTDASTVYHKTVKGTIPGFVHSKHLTDRWGLHPLAVTGNSAIAET